MANAWLTHVKKTMKTMKSKGTYAKGKGLGQVIKEAKKTWKKGGNEDPVPVAKESSPSTNVPSTIEDEPTAPGGRRRGRKGSKTVRRQRK